ncbi:MAG: glycosyltransferase family 4 protein [Planctomycetota bacterium]|jgi:glycosyltransferase involved in cell wall biosynthesis
MMKMNIAQVVFARTIGGAESVVQQIISHLDKAKFNSFLITNDELKPKFEGVCENIFSTGKLFTFFDFSPADRILRELNRYLPLRRKLVDSKIGSISGFLLENNITLVHSHLAWGHYALSKIRNEGLKKVMTIHGSFAMDTTISTPICGRRMVSAFNEADYVTSACNFFLRLLKDNGLRTTVKSGIIKNGINKDLIKEKEEPVVSDGRLKMTFFGGDKFNKGADILIKALDIVVNEHGHNKVHVDVLRKVGAGSEMRERVKEFHLEDNVTFAGYVSNNDHLKFISRNDLFVLCSRSEGIANTLMEAIGLDKPILATDVGGTGEIVTHGRNGYLCRTTPESLAEGIIFYINNPDKPEEYSRANKDIKSQFYWDNIVEEYENLYQMLEK